MKAGIISRGMAQAIRLFSAPKFFRSDAMLASVLVWVMTGIVNGAAPQLLSTRSAALGPSVGGNGDSVMPVISADGRYVLFVSAANDLIPGGDSRFNNNVFLRDRTSNTTVLVSANLSGASSANGNSAAGGISANGRYVLFESDANDLVAGHTNGQNDIYVRDVWNGTTVLVSVATNGVNANGPSSFPAMTPDGRFVAFRSFASNLISNDFNSIPDIFVRDLASNVTMLASVGAAAPASPFASVFYFYKDAGALAITPDGRYCAFFTVGIHLIPGVTNQDGHIYVRDLVANQTICASTNAPIYTQGTSNTVVYFHVAISDDGRYVTFNTDSSNVVNPRGNATIFRFDTSTSALDVIASNGLPHIRLVTGDYGPEMSSDGRFITFAKNESAGGDTNSSIQLWDAQTGLTTLISADVFGGYPALTRAHAPLISANGRFVVFVSDAGDLVTNTVAPGFHIYRRDVQTGTTVLVDADVNGLGATDVIFADLTISADGRYVAFAAPDGGMIAGDNNNASDVFVKDLETGNLELISQREATLVGAAGNGYSVSTDQSISANGRWVAFSSGASDLILNDTNQAEDVFVSDHWTGTTTLVSVGMNGAAALGGGSTAPVISADGRFVVFTSKATNLVAQITNSAANIFLRDLQAGTTIMINSRSNGQILNAGDSPAISQDGRYVVFLSPTNNFFTAIILRDTVANTTTLVAPAGTGPISMSATGRYILYLNQTGPFYPVNDTWRVWDVQQGKRIYTNKLSVGSAMLSPTGRRVLYTVATNILVDDVLARSNIFTGIVPVTTPYLHPFKSWAIWSADERFFTFVASAINRGQTRDVYLQDLQTGTLTLVSANSDHTGGGNYSSDLPTISRDGRFVLFRSFATDLLPGLSNAPNLFLFDRFSHSNALVTLREPKPSWSSRVYRPQLSADGRALTYISVSPMLGQPDLNRLNDIYASALPLADQDGDGMDDVWETQYFGNLDHDGSQDADGDGASDLAEYLAGTNPTDPLSVLALRASPAGSGTNLVLTWSGAPGRAYRVQYKDDLNRTNWLDFSTNFFVTGNLLTNTVPQGESNRYYRVIEN